VALAARCDASGAKDASVGQKFYEEIRGKVRKMEEPDEGRLKKALPKPIMESSKKRGGRKVRAAKARFKETEIHKLANKRSFGLVNGEYGDDAMGMDMGMLGSARANGALRVDNKGTQKVRGRAKKRCRCVRAREKRAGGRSARAAGAVGLEGARAKQRANGGCCCCPSSAEAGNHRLSGGDPGGCCCYPFAAEAGNHRLSGGDPPNPPRGRRARTRARSHLR
jgi:hypothetical protein